MDTSEIRYRVADFLKQHPPFNAVEDADLVSLAANGRVRFFPNDEFLAWQGEPHKTHILVIQQGTVSLGVLVAFLQYSRRFFQPISDLSEKFNLLQAALALDDVFEFGENLQTAFDLRFIAMQPKLVAPQNNVDQPPSHYGSKRSRKQPRG